jgi:mobilization protein NikA
MARRKKHDAGERQTAFVGFWVTPAQAAELDAAAEQQGASRSDFARELIFRRLGKPGIVAGTQRNPEKDALFAALRAAAFEHSANGNNLNQIARQLNMTGELTNWADLREAVALFKKAEALYIAALEQVLTP